MKIDYYGSKCLALLSIFIVAQANSFAIANTIIPEPATANENLSTPVGTDIDVIQGKLNSDKSPDTPEVTLESESPIEDVSHDQTSKETLIAQVEPDDAKPVLREGISMNDREVENKIDDLTKQILLKEVELERFAIKYNLVSGKQGRWKGWRYGAFGEANLGLGLAGGIISVVNRGGHLGSPTKVNVRTQESANYIPMIGNIIGCGAAGLEFGINEFHELQAMRQGYSPGKARKRVKDLKKEIVDLLDQRDRAVKTAFGIPTLKARAELDQAEQRVLKDLLAQSLQQFERFYLGSRRLLAFQQMQYFFDIAKNATSAVGYQQAYSSLHRHHRIYNGYAGLLFCISGGIYMTGPVLSRAFGKLVAERHRRLLKPTTEIAEERTMEDLKRDHALLKKICKETNCSSDKTDLVVERSSMVYGSGEKHFEDSISQSEKTRDKAVLVATQNIGAAAFVGGTKVGSGVLFLVPGYNRRYNVNSGTTAARGTNDFLFASSLISLPATSFAILDTLRINIRGEINRAKLKKDGRLPPQLAKVRLDELDQIEKRVKAIKL